MTAAVLYGKEDVRVEPVALPPVGPGEVRIRIRAALTCGTDLKVYRRGYHAKMIQPPVPFGHELAGEIEAVGEGVTDWKPGDRVVAANSAACDRCFYCERGRPELCEDLLFLNGAYAEYVTAPERIVRKNLLRVPDHLSFAEAAMVEPLACVVRGMEETGVRPGDTVAVLGVGPIGLMFVRLCKLAGARVIAVGRGRPRLEFAERMGADVLLSAAEQSFVVGAVRRAANGGRGPDVVIECIGQVAAWEQAISMSRKGAVINLFGGCPKHTHAKLDTGRLHYDELTLKGTFHHTPETVREALRLIAEDCVPAREFIQSRAKLEDVPELFRAMNAGASAVKVAVEP
jgi:L-iditol 2-dehydrogenase